MRQKTNRHQDGAERTIKDIRRQTRKRYSAEEKIRIVLAGLRGEDSIAELCRQEGIAQGMYYSWSKEFLEAGKKRLAGDTANPAPITCNCMFVYPVLWAHHWAPLLLSPVYLSCH
jgi:transposase